MFYTSVRNGISRTLFAIVSMLIAIGSLLIITSRNNISLAAQDPWKPYPILESCTRADAQYAGLFFNNEDFDDWPEKYHEAVDAVIEEYLDPPQTIECLDPNILPINQFTSIYALAAVLPPWQDPVDLAELDRNDVGIVLLEFLRVYECALADHNFFLPMDVIQERFEDEAAGGPLPFIIANFRFEDLLKEMGRRRRVIEEEIATARPTLERALVIVSSVIRFSFLDAELECLQRASLDLRNSLALAADASVCMPKGWDVKDPLRDL